MDPENHYCGRRQPSSQGPDSQSPYEFSGEKYGINGFVEFVLFRFVEEEHRDPSRAMAMLISLTV